MLHVPNGGRSYALVFVSAYERNRFGKVERIRAHFRSYPCR